MTPVGSLAYRKNESGIWNGTVPEKYTRLLPYITGRRILEIGAAEGVQSLLISERNPSSAVIAVEQDARRHEVALELQDRWLKLSRKVEFCTMVHADIRDRLDLFAGVETFVAIRTIYHLGISIPAVFAAAANAGVSSIVLGGNPNRGRRAEAGTGDPFDEYAGIEGMKRVLQDAGYTIGSVVKEGDPIVTGHR